MLQNTLILDVLENIFEQGTQKLILRVSVSTKRLCLKDAIEKEHILSDKAETDLKGDVKMTSYTNNMKKDAILDL